MAEYEDRADQGPETGAGQGQGMTRRTMLRRTGWGAMAMAGTSLLAACGGSSSSSSSAQASSSGTAGKTGGAERLDAEGPGQRYPVDMWVADVRQRLGLGTAGGHAHVAHLVAQDLVGAVGEHEGEDV